VGARKRGRYSQVRSINTSLRAIIRDNIDRKNYLQIRTFAALRAMRAVFCGVSLCWGTKVPYPPKG
jgi:hypothetical protein